MQKCASILHSRFINMFCFLPCVAKWVPVTAWFLLMTFNFSPVMAALPENGTSTFSKLTLDEAKWHIDPESGNAVIDSVSISGWESLGEYPCEELWKTIKPTSRFRQCRFVLNAGGAIQSVSLDLKATKAILQIFMLHHGLVSAKPVNPSLGLSYHLIIEVESAMSVAYAYLPKTAANNGPGVPPTEVDPPLQCSISGGNIDHRTISAENVQQNTARTSVNVTCNRSASVLVRSRDYNASTGLTLQGPGTLHSTIDIDGVTADKGVTRFVNNSVSLSVSSMLREGKEVAAGSYSGSVILETSIL